MNIINPYHNNVLAFKCIIFWLDSSTVTERSSALFYHLGENALHWEENSTAGWKKN